MGAQDRFCGVCGAALGASAPADKPPCGGAARPSSAAFTITCFAPRALRAGYRSSFCFRLESSRDDLAGAKITMAGGDAVLGSKEVTVPCGECIMNITPTAPGSVFLGVFLDVEYLDGGGKETYSANFRVSVNEKRDAPRTFVYSPTVQVQGSVLRLNGGGSLVGVPQLPAGGCDAAEDMACYECDMSNPRRLELTLERSPDAVTLAGETAEIAVVHRDSLTLGRSSSSDLTLPLFDGRGMRDDRMSLHVSSVHMRVCLHDGRCLVRDGGEERPSTNGTSIDGARLRPGGSGLLSVGRSHRVAVMYAPSGDRELVPMTATVSGDRWTQKPSGVVLRREDGVRSSVAAVWGSAGAELAPGVSVGWDGARFCAVRGGSRRPLAVGDEIDVGGVAYRVMPFHQRFPRKTGLEQTTERSSMQ